MSESFNSFYLQNHLFLKEVLQKSFSGDDALLENNLLYLLSEGDLDQPDVEALRSSTSKLKEFLSSVLSVDALSLKLPSAAAWYKAQGRNIQAAENFVMKLDLNEPKGAKDWVKSVFGKGFTVGNGVATVALIDTQAAGGLQALGEAVTLIQRNLEGKLADDVPLVNVPADTGLTKEDIAAAVKKAFNKSMGNEDIKDSQSFMKKLGGKAAKIPGVTLSDFPLDAVLPEIMNLTLPELASLVEALNSVPTPSDSAVDDAMANVNTSIGDDGEKIGEVDDVLTADEVGKAGQIWLDRLKADGADAAMLKLGQQWMAAVSKDPEFKKVAGVSESYNFSLSTLLLEQVKWPDMVRVFIKNAPGPLKGLGSDSIEPLIAPFAQALVDQGVEVVDKSGNPIKTPTSDTEEVIEDIEEDLPEDEAALDGEEAGEGDEQKTIKGLIADKIVSGVELLKNPKEAIQKIVSLFDLTLEENKDLQFKNLLFEKVVNYDDVVNAIKDHLPQDENEKIQTILQLRDLIQQELGKDYSIENIPEVAEEVSVEPGQIRKFTNSKGAEGFVKVVEPGPRPGTWMVAQPTKDGKKWKSDKQTFAAKSTSFGDQVEESEVFPNAEEEVSSTQSIKSKEFSDKISAAYEDIYITDEELMDALQAANITDKEVPAVIRKVSQELFSSDFALEETYFKKSLSNLLFEGEYEWADVKRSIDKHSGDIPNDLIYSIFAKAAPTFEELGVKIPDIPKVDIAAIKSSLSKEEEEEDPNEELDIDDPAGISDEEQKKLDDDAKAVAGTLGKIPIDKNKLAAILKKHPDIVGQGQKSTRARRKLRKAINMAAGMEVFAEHFDYGSFQKEKYILNESSEQESIARWKKLAGIQDD